MQIDISTFQLDSGKYFLIVDETVSGITSDIPVFRQEVFIQITD